MTREQIEDKTWEGAVAYVRDMAKTIRNLTQRFVADGAISELATVRAEALEECADGMERAAKKARAALPASAPAVPVETSPIFLVCTQCGAHQGAVEYYERRVGEVLACRDGKPHDWGGCQCTECAAPPAVSAPRVTPEMPAPQCDPCYERFLAAELYSYEIVRDGNGWRCTGCGRIWRKAEAP